MFLTPKAFRNYCETFNRLGVLNSGHNRTVNCIDQCISNRTCYFTCPLALFCHLVPGSRRLFTLIKISPSYRAAGDCIYTTPWDTGKYEKYTEMMSAGHLFLVDVYYDGATLTKLVTSSATFVLVWFSNLKLHMETWFTVGIVPSSRSIPTNIPADERLQLKLQLLHRFIFLLFKPLIQDSYHSFVVDCSTYCPRMLMC